MPVIDVDAHFEPADDWLDEFPALKARLPDRYPTGDPRFAMRSPEMFAWFVTDDLLRGVPPERRMPMDRLVTPHMRRLYDADRGPEAGYPGSNQHMPMVDTDVTTSSPGRPSTAATARTRCGTTAPTST